MVDYITETVIKKIEPATDTTGVFSSPIREIQPPLSTTLWLTNGTTLQGKWQVGAPTGQVGVLLNGATQPVAIPLTTIARLSLTESPEAEKSGATTQQMPQTSAATQTLQKPFVGKVLLQDNTSLTGQVNYDANTHTVVITALSSEGQRTVNYLTGQLVKQIDPVAEEVQGQPPATTDLRPPLATVIWMTNGTTFKGTWQAGAPAGHLGLLPEGAAQPTVIPLSLVARFSLTESSTASTVTAEQSGQAQEKKTSGGGEKTLSPIKDSLSTAIPIGPLAESPATIPPQGSEVVVTTNLGQRFTGIVEFNDGDWMGLKVSSLAAMPLSPPQLSVINRAHIISVKNVEQSGTAKN